jgi:hypothetical protein
VDEWRTADPATRRAIEARVREQALLVQSESGAIQEEMARIQAGAAAWPVSRGDDDEERGSDAKP